MGEKALIVVPTYNEFENIEPLTHQVRAHLPDADILVVDDASPDGTGELVERLATQDPKIRVIRRGGKLGLGTAYLTGFRYGLQRGYDYLFEMDADFSHDPRYLPDLQAAARDGADLVLGSRYVGGGGTVNWGPLRQAVSRGGNLYARMILGVGLTDLTSGFKCFRREVLEAIDLDAVRSEGYAFQIEMTYRALGKGFRVEEVPIVFVDRRAGQSKLSSGVVAEAIWMVWCLRLGLQADDR